jgi:VRR-NUC domain/Fanconi anemia-associated nuclease SAP domain
VLSDSSPPAPFYYLQNFERALAWLCERYDEVLDSGERTFFAEFARLPIAPRALLVRMMMRKGPHFRASRLKYVEIGCPLRAAAPLVERGWIDPDPRLALEELFALSTRSELQRIFPDAAVCASARKSAWLDALRVTHAEARRFADWHAASDDRVLQLTITALGDRLRLMFFGNLHQDWSEFVLADLGVFRYESVCMTPSARAFRRRADVDAWLALHACREALETCAEDASLEALAARAAELEIDNEWIETRRAKLFFRIGYRAEQRGETEVALAAYERSAWPGARYRRMRVLERTKRFGEAFSLASDALQAPENEEEHQRITRMMPRLRRHLRLPAAPAVPAEAIPREQLVLSPPPEPLAVELVARDHLHAPSAPVYYVENTLINSLFGLLCWKAVFAPLPGAFFHPFQRGPADLHEPDFKARRAVQFAACLAELDSGAYRQTIVRHFHRKAGLQSPFVSWGLLCAELLELALDCVPAMHLKLWFTRILEDVRANRSGLPDLIRFWPNERRYELVEVKGPGDRLQDNQVRWLQFCLRHGMPVRVVDIVWARGAA